MLMNPLNWIRFGFCFFCAFFLVLFLEQAEEAVCLADFCDILRCEVFQSEESSSLRNDDQPISTDIEVWGDSLGQNSALAKANSAYLRLLPIRFRFNSISEFM